MGNLTLHIGAAKCGSSALQAALTANPVLRGHDGKMHVYAAIKANGDVDSGKRLVPSPVFGYRAAVDFRDILALPDAVIAKMGKELGRLENPILSNESLLVDHESAAAILGKMGLTVDAVAYIRPQVEYVNSAWWQWGAWFPGDRERWIEQRIRRSMFHRFLTAWKAIPQVRSVTVRLLPADIVGDFMNVIGVDPAEAPSVRTNKSLPGPLLRLVQRNQSLRTRYKGRLDFVLPRVLPVEKLGKTPWVIDQNLADRIVKKARAGNLKLLDMLDPESAAIMRADLRWWDATAYADRPVEPFEPPAAVSPETDQLAVAMLEAILGK